MTGTPNFRADSKTRCKDIWPYLTAIAWPAQGRKSTLTNRKDRNSLSARRVVAQHLVRPVRLNVRKPSRSTDGRNAVACCDGEKKAKAFTSEGSALRDSRGSPDPDYFMGPGQPRPISGRDRAKAASCPPPKKNRFSPVPSGFNYRGSLVTIPRAPSVGSRFSRPSWVDVRPYFSPYPPPCQRVQVPDKNPGYSRPRVARPGSFLIIRT